MMELADPSQTTPPLSEPLSPPCLPGKAPVRTEAEEMGEFPGLSDQQSGPCVRPSPCPMMA